MVGQSRHRTSGGRAAESNFERNQWKTRVSVQKGKPARLQAAEIIRRGGVIAFRTDTFYGLGAEPSNAQAVRRIVELKGREERKPILLLISEAEVVRKYLAQTSERFDVTAKRFWPGPLTLIGTARAELAQELTAGTGTIGLRMPDNDDVRALVRACGGALTATSANPTGKAPARTAEEVEAYFPIGVDLIIDGGEVTVTEPSTVLDLSGPVPHLIREGAITHNELESSVSELGFEITSKSDPRNYTKKEIDE